jgi:hypothetical protein
VRDAVGFVKHPPEKLFVQRTDTSAERMDIDGVVRKAEGANKKVNVPPPKAERARLYKEACGNAGDVLQITSKRTADQMPDGPFWTKTVNKDNNLQLPPAAPHYQDMKQKHIYDTMNPRPLMTFPARPASTMETGTRFMPGLSDPRTLPRRKMFRDPNFYVPDAEPVVDDKATTWGPVEGKRWVERVGHGNGFWQDITSQPVDWKKMEKRRMDSKKAYRLIRERGRNSALDALFSNVCD